MSEHRSGSHHGNEGPHRRGKEQSREHQQQSHGHWGASGQSKRASRTMDRTASFFNESNSSSHQSSRRDRSSSSVATSRREGSSGHNERRTLEREASHASNRHAGSRHSRGSWHPQHTAVEEQDHNFEGGPSVHSRSNDGSRYQSSSRHDSGIGSHAHSASHGLGSRGPSVDVQSRRASLSGSSHRITRSRGTQGRPSKHSPHSESHDHAFEHVRSSHIESSRARSIDHSETQPLIRDRSFSRRAPRSKTTPRPNQSLLRHILKCGRLALQAQHPDFTKDGPHTVKVLREAAELSRPLIEDVKSMLEEEGRETRGEKLSGPKAMLMKKGIAWIEKQVEEAERDVRRMERRHKGKRKKKHRREKDGEAGISKTASPSRMESSSESEREEETRTAEDRVNDWLRQPSGDGGDYVYQPVLSQHEMHGGRGGPSRSIDGSHTGSVRQREERSPQHDAADEVDQLRPSAPGSSSRHSGSSYRSTGRQTPGTATYRTPRASTVHSGQNEQTSNASINQRHDMIQSLASLSRRSQRAQSQSQPQPHGHTQGPSGEGLAAEYYSSFQSEGPVSDAFAPSGRPSSSTLRPEDSLSMRRLRPRVPRSSSKASDRLRSERRSPRQAAELSRSEATGSSSRHATRRDAGHSERRSVHSWASSEIPPPPIGPGWSGEMNN